MEADDVEVVGHFNKTANEQAFLAMSRKVKPKIYCMRNDACNAKQDHIYQYLFLGSLILWKCLDGELSGCYSDDEAFKHCHRPTLLYQRLKYRQNVSDDRPTKSETSEAKLTYSFWCRMLVVSHPRNIICWIFQKLSSLGHHTREAVVLVEIKKNAHAGVKFASNYSCTLEQKNLNERLIQIHLFHLGYDIGMPDNATWFIEILVPMPLNKTSTEEDRRTICINKIGTPTWYPKSNMSSEEESPRTDTYHTANSNACLYLENPKDGSVMANSYLKSEVEKPLIYLTETTDCQNAQTLNISVEKKILLSLVSKNEKIYVKKIITSSKSCKQFEYCCVFKRDILALVINVQSKSQAEDRPVMTKENSAVRLGDFCKDDCVDLYHEWSDVKCEGSGERNQQSSDCAEGLNKVFSKKLKTVIQQKKHNAKHLSIRKSRRYSGCHARCMQLQMFISVTNSSMKITLSDVAKEFNCFRHCLVVNCEILQCTKGSNSFRLHHKLEDSYDKDICDDVDYYPKEISQPDMTKNSIHMVSWNNCLTNCGSKQHTMIDEICSKTSDTYDLPFHSDIMKKCSLVETNDVELHNRFYQEVPEEQKLLQPPEVAAANKSFRISTLINSGVHVSNCSVENLCDAGFYLGEDGLIHCYRCHVTFPIEEFHPRDPYNAKWHGHICNGSDLRTESDGRISDDVRDPPGQQSIYIPSGDVRDERYRLSTFAKYPVSSAASKVNLAKAGFYFTGYSDKVRCFSCGRTVERWEAADNPLDATWHKSSCAMQRGLACGNIPILSQFHIHSSVQNSNQFTSGPHRNYFQSGSASHSQGVRGAPRLSASQTLQNSNVASTSQRPRQWRMANVVSSDHRRHLTNLFLNRELDRLASFARWPVGRQTVSPESLAKAGFFYLGDADRTQCFSCGGVLRNWTAGDSVEVEHRQNFPQCQMVQGMETRNVPIPMRPESREERERNFPCRHPTNPHMRSEATRVDTFDRRWPMGRIQATPDQIAHAGFFFLGDRDRTKCWYCNGGLQNWDYEDAPWVEHAKWFPNCQFLLRMKGQHFVYRHLVSNAHLQRPIIAKQEGSSIDQSSSGLSTASSTPRTPDEPPESRSTSQPAATPTIIDPREEIRKRKEIVQKAMKNSDIVKNTITMGFDLKIIESLLEDKLAEGKQANNEDIYDSMSELLNDVMKKEQEREEEKNRRATEAAVARAGPSMFPSFSSTVPMTSYMSSPVQPTGRGKFNVDYEDDDDDDDDDAMNMYGSAEGATTHIKASEPIHPAVSAIGNLQDTAAMQEAIAKIEEESLCKICFVNKADMVFLPCSHMCCCMECTQAIRQCPLCRIPIERAIKTYVTE